MNKKILIVEDDEMINNMIKEALELDDYICFQTFSGTEGLMVLKNESIDLVILDLMLPGKRGEDVIREIKLIKKIPVIIVSAKDGIESKVDLLKNGADDYLTKPFNIKELEARVEVSLRRYSEYTEVNPKENSSGEQNHTIVYKEIEINPFDYYVKVNGNTLDLTKHEFSILELLIRNSNRAFSKQAIYDYAWDEEYLGEDNTINVHISNIRKKIKKFSDTEYIETVWGIGFKLKK